MYRVKRKLQRALFFKVIKLREFLILRGPSEHLASPFQFLFSEDDPESIRHHTDACAWRSCLKNKSTTGTRVSHSRRKRVKHIGPQYITKMKPSADLSASQGILGQ